MELPGAQFLNRKFLKRNLTCTGAASSASANRTPLSPKTSSADSPTDWPRPVKKDEECRDSCTLELTKLFVGSQEPNCDKGGSQCLMVILWLFCGLC